MKKKKTKINLCTKLLQQELNVYFLGEWETLLGKGGIKKGKKIPILNCKL